MKKVVCFLCVLAMMVTFAVPAFAAGKDDIMSELNAGITVGDKTKQIPAQYINAAQQYLDNNQLTDEQYAAVLANVKAAKQIVVDSGITEFKDLDAATKNAIVAEVQKAADTLGLKVTIDIDNKTVAVTDKDGKVIFSNGDPIKPTGAQADATAAIVIGFVILAVVGAGVFTAKKLQLAKE